MKISRFKAFYQNFGTNVSTKQKKLGGGSFEIATSVIPPSNGGYAIAVSRILGLLKTDANGIEEWIQSYESPFFKGLYPSDSTCRWQLCSWRQTRKRGRRWNFWLLKTTSTGQQVWNITYGGPRREIIQSLIRGDP